MRFVGLASARWGAQGRLRLAPPVNNTPLKRPVTPLHHRQPYKVVVTVVTVVTTLISLGFLDFWWSKGSGGHSGVQGSQAQNARFYREITPHFCLARNAVPLGKVLAVFPHQVPLLHQHARNFLGIKALAEHFGPLLREN